MGATVARAHEPITTKLTWTQEISRIIYKRCASCHHEGGTAFSLMTYDEARPWAKAIREEVLERSMPPWGAVVGVGAFRDDPSLTPLEIEMLVSWVEGGAPEGDVVYLPPHAGVRYGAKSAAGAKPLLIVESTVPLIVARAYYCVAITPRDMPEGSSMEVTAYKPDGEVEHLIWLRNYREEWTRDLLVSRSGAASGGDEGCGGCARRRGRRRFRWVADYAGTIMAWCWRP